MTEKLVETIEIPEGIQIELNGNDIKVSTNGKENTRHFKSTEVLLKKADSKIEVWAKSERKNVLAESKTIGSHIKNLMHGLHEDFVYKLEVVYSHFPMTVKVNDGIVEINNLAGGKKPRKAKILGKTKVEVKGKEITVSGHNKENVGQTAANMEQATKIKGKDIRVYTDGIYITEKAKTV
ncbi:MAG: 50S ribosomal protein L6 [Candidatus Diapherotrites archaeon]|uniref:50S ribosomal protein L6 n=1 Tax=Candidatus Iainarchaeum sp. TaxID=3101447 RepID=A0A2D6LPK5_9ARCH|nr:50S ribosomal protein L6 [Candidatus Diapherotrites archaeon]|tara:strand:+ start:3612 stop:4151 length:540 start_codon:yes stop_codon:yes gene_type:complete